VLAINAASDPGIADVGDQPVNREYVNLKHGAGPFRFGSQLVRPQVRTRAPKARTQGADPDFCSVTGG
jgi:hypothetical protein